MKRVKKALALKIIEADGVCFGFDEACCKSSRCIIYFQCRIQSKYWVIGSNDTSARATKIKDVIHIALEYKILKQREVDAIIFDRSL